MLELMYITNNPDIAMIADEAGVDRVWIDLEYKDKEKRQKGLDTVKSHHSVSDISKIKPLLKQAKMQVRVNHINDSSKEEIDSVIAAGAEYVMLPYYKTLDEVQKFVDFVDGRATTILLLETKEAVHILDETLKIPGVDEIHIGLNDLHLSLHQDFMFEPVANGMVEDICKKIEAVGKPYGFGGIARLHEGMVPAEMVLAEHYRFGSTRAILSRSFCNPPEDEPFSEIRENFIKDLANIRNYEKELSVKDGQFFDDAHKEFQKAVYKVAEIIRSKKQ